MDDTNPGPSGSAPAQPPLDPMARTDVPETWRQVVAPRTGSTLISNPVPTPPPAPPAALEPRTGRTLMDGPVIPAVPPIPREAMQGATLVGNPSPVDPVWEASRVGKARPPEAMLGATLVGHPVLSHPEVPSAEPDPGGYRPVVDSPGAPVAARHSEPPESNRLALRSSLPPPAFVEREAAWLGGYHVLARLRSDAVGTEYLCRPTDDPGARHVLKVLRARLPDDAAHEAYLRFANRLAKLSHPNVLGVLDAGVYQQQPYLVRPHVDAVRLTELLAETSSQSRPAGVVLRIFDDVLEGLVAAHTRRHVGKETIHFVHGTLTADHVLVRSDGRALVAGVGEVTILGPTSNDPGQDLLALRILIEAALSGGVDEQELRLRWFADAQRGPEVRAAELLRELRETTAQARLHTRSENVASWLRALQDVRRRRTSRPPADAGSPAGVPGVPVRTGGFASFRAWWKRLFRGKG